MKLQEVSNQIAQDVRAAWMNKGYELPDYNREKLKQDTKQEPVWVHFGAGNIFRAFPAVELQNLLNAGEYNKGVIVCEAFDHDIITKAYQPYDGMSLSVVLKADGTIEKKVVGSVTEALVADACKPEDYNRLKEIFCQPSLQMVSFTITEKGYSLVDAAGEYYPAVVHDLSECKDACQNIMGKVASLLYNRYQQGAQPLALVSMDNCSHNGDKLKVAVMTFVQAWCENGLADAGFLDYVVNKVSFPWSMIDKITPRPDSKVQDILVQDGFEDTELIITDKHTYTAPFVNSEETGYLVIEDDFPNGRPPLEKSTILFTKREIVDKVEKMKVCTCLNPLHTALAIYGCLLSYTTIHDEMEDPELSELVKKIGYIEGMPVATNPGILNPKDFIDAVVNLRLPNPFMPDAPQRIATDTSQKLPIRFGETLKAYLASDNLDIQSLTFIPLVLAGWCRYLMGVDDQGEKFEQSPDPLLDKMKTYLTSARLGERPTDVHAILQPILSDSTIFAVDCYEAGIGEKIEQMFLELIEGPGAVRKTLQKYL